MSCGGWAFANRSMGARFPRTKKKTREEIILEERRKMAFKSLVKKGLIKPKRPLSLKILRFFYPLMDRNTKRMVDDTERVFYHFSQKDFTLFQREMKKMKDRVNIDEEDTDDSGLGNAFPLDLVNKDGTDSDTYEDWIGNDEEEI